MNAAEHIGTAELTAGEAAGQSLATGTAGTALLHIERALTGSGNWGSAHARIREATAAPIDAAPRCGLYYGAPAIAYMLHAAESDGRHRYRSAAQVIDKHVVRLARRRLAIAADRMERGETATFGEYDLFHGLTGIGALLLRHMAGSDALADVLRYLVTLTLPRREDGVQLPGWWVAHDPDPTLPTPGGHANFGMAHGAAGFLALFALGTSRGYVVDGQDEAIEYLGAWFDQWQQDSADGPWWPQWVTRQELRTGQLTQRGPGRPSWCYGTAGIARAQQLAAISREDLAWRTRAEDAMAGCLTDRHLGQINDAGLCHGMAGVFQTVFRAAADAENAAIVQRLPALAAALAGRAAAGQDTGLGLLTGDAGLGLALETMRRGAAPLSGWDACLLIT